LTYEPVGLLDLPPGYRGYGDDLRVDMNISIEEYNDKIPGEQKNHGRIETSEPIGTKLPKELWKSEGGEAK
jgi:hypothetical protein